MPKVYQSLESEQYLLTALQNDKKLARLQARKSFSQGITNFFLVVSFGVAGYLAIKTMPDWLPVAVSAFHDLTNYKFA